MTTPLRLSIASGLLVALLAPAGAWGEEISEPPRLRLTFPVDDGTDAAPKRVAPRKAAEAQKVRKAKRKAADANRKRGVATPTAAKGAAPAARPSVAKLEAAPKSTRPGSMTAGPSQGGNGAGGPNLRIESIVAPSSPEGFPNSGYCGPNGLGGGASTLVRFFVRNVGDIQAGPSTAAVHFSDAGMATAQVGSLMPGASATIEVDIPQACWGPSAHGSCDFLLEADRNDSVDETEDSADNYDDGTCMLPGT